MNEGNTSKPGTQDATSKADAQENSSDSANSNTHDDTGNRVIELNQFRERAEKAAASAEEANRKAQSESGYAFNAKKVCEEHATAIASIKGRADADYAGLAAVKKSVEDAAAATTVARTAADAGAKAATDAKTLGETSAAAAKVSGERVALLLGEIEKTQQQINVALTNATTSAADAAASKAAVEAAATAITASQTQLAELAVKATTDGGAIAKHEGDAKTLLGSLSQAAATVKTMQENITKYEGQLKEQARLWKELHEKIEGLLPNATSAGLASAFRNQQGRFGIPQRNWLITFVATIALLLAAGFVGLPGFWPGVSDGGWDTILRHFVGRLPLVVPLVWLGIFAGRNYMLALRVQEEYAFKEAVSTAFEGYKREMAGIAGNGQSGVAPIVNLCENILRILTRRPGQIYEGKQEDITPIGPLAKVMAEAAQTLKDQKPN